MHVCIYTHIHVYILTYICTYKHRRGFSEEDLSYVFGDDRTEDANGASPSASSAHILVKGSYSTKVTSLVREILALPEGDKAIVFSEWDDMLQIISTALTENEVCFMRVVCAHECVCVRACVRACVCMCVQVCTCVPPKTCVTILTRLV
jgi:hypothetical protein